MYGTKLHLYTIKCNFLTKTFYIFLFFWLIEDDETYG